MIVGRFIRTDTSSQQSKHYVKVNCIAFIKRMLIIEIRNPGVHRNQFILSIPNINVLLYTNQWKIVLLMFRYFEPSLQSKQIKEIGLTHVEIVQQKQFRGRFNPINIIIDLNVSASGSFQLRCICITYHNVGKKNFQPQTIHDQQR